MSMYEKQVHYKQPQSTKAQFQDAKIQENKDPQLKSFFKQNRPQQFQKIIQELDQIERKSYIFSLAQHSIFEASQKNNQHYLLRILPPFNFDSTEWINVKLNMGGFVFQLKIVSKAQKYNLNKCNLLGYGSFGQITKYQHFQQQVAIKRIKHNYLTVQQSHKLYKQKQQQHRQKFDNQELFLQGLAKKHLKDIIDPQRKNRQKEIEELRKQFQQQKQKFKQIVISGIKQSCILKFCSALKVGPRVFNDNIDIVLYEDCLCFFMEKCKVNVYDFQLKKINDIFAELRDNLILIHRFHLIHSDIKPQNTLYSPTFKKFVFADFGLSKFIEQEVGGKLIKLNSFSGTLKYAYPQMVKIYLQKQPKFIDFYQNDWHALEKTLQQLRQFSDPTIEKTQPKKEHLELQFVEIIRQNSILYETKLNHIKLKILLKDLEYLKKNIAFIKLFKKQLLAFVSKLSLSWQMQSLLTFVLNIEYYKFFNCWNPPRENRYFWYFDESHDIKSDKKQYICQRGSLLYSKEQIVEIKNKEIIDILEFINLSNIRAAFIQIQKILKIQKQIQTLITLFKNNVNLSFENQEKLAFIEREIEIKIIGKFTGYSYIKELRKCIKIIYQLIFQYINMKSFSYIWKHKIYDQIYALLYFHNILLYILPIETLVQQSGMDFYVKLNILFCYVIHTTKLKNYDGNHISKYFQQQQISSQQYSFILEKINKLCSLFLQFKELEVNKLQYFQKDCKNWMIKQNQNITKTQELIDEIFEEQYFMKKLYAIWNYVSQNTPKIKIARRNDRLPNIKSLKIQRGLSQTYNYNNTTRNETHLRKYLRQCQQVYVLFPQLTQQSILFSYMIWLNISGNAQETREKFQQLPQHFKFILEILIKNGHIFEKNIAYIQIISFRLNEYKKLNKFIEKKEWKQIFNMLEILKDKIYINNSSHLTKTLYYRYKNQSLSCYHAIAGAKQGNFICLLLVLNRLQNCQIKYHLTSMNAKENLIKKEDVELLKNIWNFDFQYYGILKIFIFLEDSEAFLDIYCKYATKFMNYENLYDSNNLILQCLATIMFAEPSLNFKQQLYKKLTWKFYEENITTASYIFPIHIQLMISLEQKWEEVYYDLFRMSAVIAPKFVEPFKYQLFKLMQLRKRLKRIFHVKKIIQPMLIFLRNWAIISKQAFIQFMNMLLTKSKNKGPLYKKIYLIQRKKIRKAFK